MDKERKPGKLEGETGGEPTKLGAGKGKGGESSWKELSTSSRGTLRSNKAQWALWFCPLGGVRPLSNDLSVQGWGGARLPCIKDWLGGPEMETEIVGSPWLARGKRQRKTNSDPVIILKQRINLRISLDFGESAGSKNKGENEEDPRIAKERWDQGRERGMPGSICGGPQGWF